MRATHHPQTLLACVDSEQQGHQFTARRAGAWYGGTRQLAHAESRVTALRGIAVHLLLLRTCYVSLSSLVSYGCTAVQIAQLIRN